MEKSGLVSRRPNIWKLQANKEVDDLIIALSYSDPDIRKRAAAALRVLGENKAVPALKQQLERERHPDVREHLVAALEHLDEAFAEDVVKQKDLTELINMLSDPEAEAVIRASTALGEMGDQLATESLVMVFRNPVQRDDVRLAAAEALLKLKSAPAVVTLLAGLRKPNWRVRHNAAAVLGQLRATWATEPLIERLSDEHPNVRLAAAAALHRFQTPRALEGLEMYKASRTGKTQPLSMPASMAAKPPEDPKKTDAVVVGDADQLADTRPRRPEGLTEAIKKAQAAASDRSQSTQQLSSEPLPETTGPQPVTETKDAKAKAAPTPSQSEPPTKAKPTEEQQPDPRPTRPSRPPISTIGTADQMLDTRPISRRSLLEEVRKKKKEQQTSEDESSKKTEDDDQK